MIVLSVTSYNGQRAEPVEACFDELGGSIGRADGNLLVLADPMRSVSRVHAHVAYRGGAYTIEDRGSNPIQVNGKVVGRERPWPLAAGDVLRIGGYEISVRERVPPEAGRAVASPAPMSGAAAANAIPPDWDPMAGTTAAQAAPRPSVEPRLNPAPKAVAPAVAPPDAPPVGGSIDELFGLGEPVVVDATLSGFIDLTDAPPARPAPVDAAPAAGLAPAAANGGLAVAAEAGAARGRPAPVVSWDGGGVRETKVVAPAAAPAPGPAPVAATPAATAVPSPRLAPRSAAPQQGAGVGDDALLQAFLEGLRTVDAAPPIARLTPELMRRVGALLGESVRGAVDLLHARAAVKREVRAEVTAIRPQQNNVIKFSPSAAVALQYLLGEAAPGFMGAEASMRDAFDDLRAHELAVMAGMRAALTGLLQRFDPAQLEGRIVARSALGSLLAGGRRAQLWEAYRELFAQLSAEARDDFHEVFGNAFVRAYEEQMLGLHEDPLEAPRTRAGEG